MLLHHNVRKWLYNTGIWTKVTGPLENVLVRFKWFWSQTSGLVLIVNLSLFYKMLPEKKSCLWSPNVMVHDDNVSEKRKISNIQTSILNVTSIVNSNYPSLFKAITYLTSVAATNEVIFVSVIYFSLFLIIETKIIN